MITAEMYAGPADGHIVKDIPLPMPELIPIPVLDMQNEAWIAVYRNAHHVKDGVARYDWADLKTKESWDRDIMLEDFWASENDDDDTIGDGPWLVG